jgi:hypothetical protein
MRSRPTPEQFDRLFADTDWYRDHADWPTDGSDLFDETPTVQYYVTGNAQVSGCHPDPDHILRVTYDGGWIQNGRLALGVWQKVAVVQPDGRITTWATEPRADVVEFGRVSVTPGYDLWPLLGASPDDPAYPTPFENSRAGRREAIDLATAATRRAGKPVLVGHFRRSVDWY